MHPRATNFASNSSSHHSGSRKRARSLSVMSARLPPRSFPNILRSSSSLSISFLRLEGIRPLFRHTSIAYRLQRVLYRNHRESHPVARFLHVYTTSKIGGDVTCLSKGTPPSQVVTYDVIYFLSSERCV